MLVDHSSSAGARICPAPTLYLGARHWAREHQEKGLEPGQVVDVGGRPSAETVMKMLGALRLGASPRLCEGGHTDAPSDDGFRGLLFGDGRRLSERELVQKLATTRRQEGRRWWSLGSWELRRTWTDDLWPALASGAELHVNLNCATAEWIEAEESWPEVIGSLTCPRAALPISLIDVPTAWRPASEL